jgi:hypothetical protein
MNLLNLKDYPFCTEFFLYANTPAYLYKHLRNLPDVNALARQLSTGELYELAKKVIGTEKTSENELIYYIYLIALSFKIYSESHPYLESLRTDKYRWADNIISFISSDYIPISEDEIHIQMRPKIIVQDVFDEVPSTTILNMTNSKHVPVIIQPKQNSSDAVTTKILMP